MERALVQEEGFTLMPQIIVDTGFIYAMADRDDAWHDSAIAFLQTQVGTLIVPDLVLPEACYLLNTYIGQEAERQFIVSLLQGDMKVEVLTMDDLQRSLILLERYAHANIGLVDASVVAIAERLRIRRVLTTDRRHFSLVRPLHCPQFELLP